MNIEKIENRESIIVPEDLFDKFTERTLAIVTKHAEDDSAWDSYDEEDNIVTEKSIEAKYIKEKEENIKATEKNIKATEKNIKTKEENIKAKEKNIKAKEKNIKAKEENIRAKEEGIKGKKGNIKKRNKCIKQNEDGEYVSDFGYTKNINGNDSTNNVRIKTLGERCIKTPMKYQKLVDEKKKPKRIKKTIGCDRNIKKRIGSDKTIKNVTGSDKNTKYVIERNRQIKNVIRCNKSFVNLVVKDDIKNIIASDDILTPMELDRYVKTSTEIDKCNMLTENSKLSMENNKMSTENNKTYKKSMEDDNGCYNLKEYVIDKKYVREMGTSKKSIGNLKKAISEVIETKECVVTLPRCDYLHARGKKTYAGSDRTGSGKKLFDTKSVSETFIEVNDSRFKDLDVRVVSDHELQMFKGFDDRPVFEVIDDSDILKDGDSSQTYDDIGNLQMYKRSGNVQNSKGSGNVQNFKCSGNLQTSKAIKSLQKSKDAKTLHVSKGIVNFQKSEGIVNLQKFKGVVNLQMSKGIVNVQKSKDIVNVQKSKDIVHLKPKKSNNKIAKSKTNKIVESDSCKSGYVKTKKKKIIDEEVDKEENTIDITNSKKFKICYVNKKKNNKINESKTENTSNKTDISEFKTENKIDEFIVDHIFKNESNNSIDNLKDDIDGTVKNSDGNRENKIDINNVNNDEIVENKIYIDNEEIKIYDIDTNDITDGSPINVDVDDKLKDYDIDGKNNKTTDIDVNINNVSDVNVEINHIFNVENIDSTGNDTNGYKKSKTRKIYRNVNKRNKSDVERRKTKSDDNTKNKSDDSVLTKNNKIDTVGSINKNEKNMHEKYLQKKISDDYEKYQVYCEFNNIIRSIETEKNQLYDLYEEKKKMKSTKNKSNIDTKINKLYDDIKQKESKIHEIVNSTKNDLNFKNYIGNRTDTIISGVFITEYIKNETLRYDNELNKTNESTDVEATTQIHEDITSNSAISLKSSNMNSTNVNTKTSDVITSNMKSTGIAETSNMIRSDVSITSNINSSDIGITSNINSLDVDITSIMNSSDVDLTSIMNSSDVDITSNMNSSDVDLTSNINSSDVDLTSNMNSSDVAITSNVNVSGVDITSNKSVTTNKKSSPSVIKKKKLQPLKYIRKIFKKDEIKKAVTEILTKSSDSEAPANQVVVTNKNRTKIPEMMNREVSDNQETLKIQKPSVNPETIKNLLSTESTLQLINVTEKTNTGNKIKNDNKNKGYVNQNKNDDKSNDNVIDNNTGICGNKEFYSNKSKGYDGKNINTNKNIFDTETTLTEIYNKRKEEMEICNRRKSNELLRSTEDETGDDSDQSKIIVENNVMSPMYILEDGIDLHETVIENDNVSQSTESKGSTIKVIQLENSMNKMQELPVLIPIGSNKTNFDDTNGILEMPILIPISNMKNKRKKPEVTKNEMETELMEDERRKFMMIENEMNNIFGVTENNTNLEGEEKNNLKDMKSEEESFMVTKDEETNFEVMEVEEENNIKVMKTKNNVEIMRDKLEKKIKDKSEVIKSKSKLEVKKNNPKKLIHNVNLEVMRTEGKKNKMEVTESVNKVVKKNKIEIVGNKVMENPKVKKQSFEVMKNELEVKKDGNSLIEVINDEIEMLKDKIEKEYKIDIIKDEIQVIKDKIEKKIKIDMKTKMESTEEKTVGTENKSVGTENKIIGTENQIIGTENKIIGTENKIIGTENQVIGMENKLIGMENKLIETEKKLIETEKKLIGMKNKIIENENKILETVSTEIHDINKMTGVGDESVDVKNKTSSVDCKIGRDESSENKKIETKNDTMDAKTEMVDIKNKIVETINKMGENINKTDETINKSEAFKEKIEVTKNRNDPKILNKNFFIISGKSGKSVTLTPKNPVYLKKDNFLSFTDQTINNKTSNNDSLSQTKDVKIFKDTAVGPDNDFGLIDTSVQTDTINFKEKYVQTEKVSEPVTNIEIDEVPNVTELIQFILAIPKYSSDIDDQRKTDILDMSRNITERSKTRNVTMIKNNNTKTELKKQFLYDIQNCMSYDYSGNMAIHNAILENNIQMLSRQIFVLNIRNISINVHNSNGLIPIQLAIINNSDITIINKLLENGADTTIIDENGNNLIHLIIMHSTSSVLTEILLKCKKFEIIDMTNDDGLTPLMLGAIEKKNDLVEVLLKSGADPNIRDEKSGRTALFHAVENDAEYIINLLLRYKADPKLNNYVGISPIDAARDLPCGQSLLLSDEYQENTVTVGTKRTRKQRNVPSKKSKITFVTSLQKIDPKLLIERPNNIQNQQSPKKK